MHDESSLYNNIHINSSPSGFLSPSLVTSSPQLFLNTAACFRTFHGWLNCSSNSVHKLPPQQQWAYSVGYSGRSEGTLVAVVNIQTFVATWHDPRVYVCVFFRKHDDLFVVTKFAHESEVDQCTKHHSLLTLPQVEFRPKRWILSGRKLTILLTYFHIVELLKFNVSSRSSRRHIYASIHKIRHHRRSKPLQLPYFRSGIEVHEQNCHILITPSTNLISIDSSCASVTLRGVVDRTDSLNRFSASYRSFAIAEACNEQLSRSPYQLKYGWEHVAMTISALQMIFALHNRIICSNGFGFFSLNPSTTCMALLIWALNCKACASKTCYWDSNSLKQHMLVIDVGR